MFFTGLYAVGWWAMPPCQVGQVRLQAVAAQRARRGIVDLHVELRIVVERLAGLRIETLGPVQDR